MNNEPNPIRILFADEQPNRRAALRRSLESEPGLHILGEASDANRAIQLARQDRPHVLLIALALAQKCEVKALNEFASHLPPVRVVVMVSTIEKAHLVDALRLGAQGVVLEQSRPHELLTSIRSVMAGQYWIESESVGVLVEALRESLVQGNGTKSPKDYGLTRREVDIISKIASGRSNKEVGEEFAISERTVKHHLTNIFGKVGVSSRLQLALFAVNEHLTISPAVSDDDI